MIVTPKIAEKIRYASFLVVDTNAWIDHLDEVLSFGKHYTLVVPSAVVQELDGLKQDQNQLGNRARDAIKAIYDATMSEASWIRGQRHDENMGDSFRPENKDDEILSCAIYFNTTVSRTVLVTADYGLALKSNINCIPTADVCGIRENLPDGLMKGWVERAIATAKINNTSVEKRPRLTKGIDIPGFCYTKITKDNDDDDRSPAGLLSMPAEVKSKILSLLPPRALLRAEETCRDLRYFLTLSSLSDAVWAASLRRHHGHTRTTKSSYLSWRRSIVAPV
jgi:rRNA-processing protein FCF1